MDLNGRCQLLPTLNLVDDVAFLNQEETLGVGLQIDYLKPELLLQEHQVEHSIVVYGGG